jgi:hypothetical protein
MVFCDWLWYVFHPLRRERRETKKGREETRDRRKRRWKNKIRRENRGGRTERIIVLEVQVVSVTFFFFEIYVETRWEKLKKVPQMAMGRVQRKLNF